MFRFPKIPYWYLLLGPTLLFAIGFALNAIVMALNGGPMPVHYTACAKMLDPEDMLHSCMTSATHLKILADWIVIKSLGIASPGDMLEWASDILTKPGLIAWVTLIIFDRERS